MDFARLAGYVKDVAHHLENNSKQMVALLNSMGDVIEELSGFYGVENERCAGGSESPTPEEMILYVIKNHPRPGVRRGVKRFAAESKDTLLKTSNPQITTWYMEAKDHVEHNR